MRILPSYSSKRHVKIDRVVRTLSRDGLSCGFDSPKRCQSDFLILHRLIGLRWFLFFKIMDLSGLFPTSFFMTSRTKSYMSLVRIIEIYALLIITRYEVAVMFPRDSNLNQVLLDLRVSTHYRATAILTNSPACLYVDSSLYVKLLKS